LDDWDRRGVTVVVTVVGAGLALVNPAAGFAGAVAAPLILDYLSERERAKARNVEVLVEKAIARAGLTPEGFLEKIKADDVKLALLREALEACWSSYDLQKIKLLSLAVAQGVNDGTRVDVSRLLVATFRDLEAIHLQVLSHFRTGQRTDQRWPPSDKVSGPTKRDRGCNLCAPSPRMPCHKRD